MATVTKFQDFSEQLIRGIHDWDAHTFKIALSNSAPLATDTILSNIAQVSGNNGYTTGGTAVTGIAISETTGTTTISGNSVTFTASGGAMGQFRYYVLYNDTAASKNLIQFWDHGSAVNLNDGDSFQIKFNNADPGAILSLA